MKNKLFVFALIAAIAIMCFAAATGRQSTRATTDYCDGWEAGYCEGWRYEKGVNAVCPIAPVCPIPELGRDKYQDGYNKGFTKGQKAAKDKSKNPEKA